MRLSSTRALLNAALLLSVFRAGAADEPKEPPKEPPKIWRPFPELPDLLWYEDFENETSNFNAGKICAEAPALPGTHCYEMGKVDWGKNDKLMSAQAMIEKTPARIPGGMNPDHITIQYMIYSEEIGELTTKVFYGDGDYERKQTIPKEKTWVPITIKFGDLRNKNSMPKPDHVIKRIELYFKPRDNKQYWKVYVDDLMIIGNNVRPMDIQPRVQMVRKMVLDLTKTPAKDGYSYSVQMQDTLKAALKSANKRHKMKTVLVMGVKPADNETLAKQLSTSATKAKANGFKFEPFVTPEGEPSAGLDDLRTLLAFNMQKSDAETALIMLSAADAARPGRPAELVRVAIERALDIGCVPIIVLPPVQVGTDPKKKSNLEGYVNSITNVCIQLGVPVIDPHAAVKGVANAIEQNDLSAAGFESFAALASQVLKHLDVHLFARKG